MHFGESADYHASNPRNCREQKRKASKVRTETTSQEEAEKDEKAKARSIAQAKAKCRGPWPGTTADDAKKMRT